MDDRYLDRDPESAVSEPVVSPAGRDERPTRPDDQLPRPELSAEDVQRMAGNEPTLAQDRDRPAPSAEHRQQLPDGNVPGEDNIREGRVGGVMGGPHQQQGEGQGG